MQFELPSRRDVKKCVVTKETVEKGLTPTLVTEAAPEDADDALAARGVGLSARLRRLRAAPERYHRDCARSRSSRKPRLQARARQGAAVGGAAAGRRGRRQALAALSAKERARLHAARARVARAGRATSASKERAELRKLARKLDLKGMGRELRAARRDGAGASAVAPPRDAARRR